MASWSESAPGLQQVGTQPAVAGTVSASQTAPPAQAPGSAPVLDSREALRNVAHALVNVSKLEAAGRGGAALLRSIAAGASFFADLTATSNLRVPFKDFVHLPKPQCSKRRLDEEPLDDEEPAPSQNLKTSKKPPSRVIVDGAPFQPAPDDSRRRPRRSKRKAYHNKVRDRSAQLKSS